MISSNRKAAFSLVEVVAAIGVVSFAVLTTVGLLSVANGTNKDARDEGLSARLASNEFDRLRSLNANFPTTYVQRAFDSNLTDLGQIASGTPPQNSAYLFNITFLPSTPSIGQLVTLNAEVRYPALAPTATQTVRRYTTEVHVPLVTPTPGP